MDDIDAMGAERVGDGVVSDAELKPYMLGWGCHREDVFEVAGDGFAAAEDVDDVDGGVELGEGGADGVVEEGLVGVGGVDGEDAVAVLVEVGGDVVGRSRWVGVGAEDSDGGG